MGIQIMPKDKLGGMDDLVVIDNAMYQAKTSGKNTIRFIDG
jgi:GGDEF domain-containing protein